MPVSIKPSDEILKYIDNHFDYEPESGDLYRLNKWTQEWYLVSPDPWFNMHSGQFTNKNIRIYTNDRTISASITNICWYLFYREWPIKEVDHKDVNPANNKISNLRLANSALQAINQNRVRKYLPGVGFLSTNINKPYYAQMKFKKQRYFLGYYASEIEAHEAYRAKYRELYGEPLQYPYKEWRKPTVVELPSEEAEDILTEINGED